MNRKPELLYILKKLDLRLILPQRKFQFSNLQSAFSLKHLECRSVIIVPIPKSSGLLYSRLLRPCMIQLVPATFFGHCWPSPSPTLCHTDYPSSAQVAVLSTPTRGHLRMCGSMSCHLKSRNVTGIESSGSRCQTPSNAWDRPHSEESPCWEWPVAPWSLDN